jgi:hypothetical protein
MISDDFYEITVDLSHYGADFKPVPIAVYNQNKLVAKPNSKKHQFTFKTALPWLCFHY